MGGYFIKKRVLLLSSEKKIGSMGGYYLQKFSSGVGWFNRYSVPWGDGQILKCLPPRVPIFKLSGRFFLLLSDTKFLLFIPASEFQPTVSNMHFKDELKNLDSIFF